MVSGAIIALALCAAVALIATARPTLQVLFSTLNAVSCATRSFTEQTSCAHIHSAHRVCVCAFFIRQGGPSVLLGVFPQPARYPQPIVTAQGSMLAADPDAEGDGEVEDEEEGKALSDMETDVDDETGKNFPFPSYARPVHAAKVDQFGRILINGNCAINSWDTHNLWPHVRDPDSDAEEYATLHSDKQKLLGTTYNFPQNADCQSRPNGIPAGAVDYRANNWGYKCFSNGKCSLFQTGKAEEDHYDEQLNDSKGVDGIAKDDGK